MNNVTVRLKVLLAGAMTTAIILSASALRAFTEGEYNCCGNSACDALKAKQACPSGDGDCTEPNFRSCCGDGENEASCFAKDNNLVHD